jgi:hypothetical protein
MILNSPGAAERKARAAVERPFGTIKTPEKSNPLNAKMTSSANTVFHAHALKDGPKLDGSPTKPREGEKKASGNGP